MKLIGSLSQLISKMIYQIVLSNVSVSRNVTKRWFNKSQRLLKDNYERIFLFRYIVCLMAFQLDRIIFMLKIGV